MPSQAAFHAENADRMQDALNKARSTGVEMPKDLHPASQRLVLDFAKAMAEKLGAAEIKYGYSDGWLVDAWQQECQKQFLQHVNKGDPRDVAIYAAFMWKRNWPLPKLS